MYRHLEMETLQGRPKTVMVGCDGLRDGHDDSQVGGESKVLPIVGRGAAGGSLAKAQIGRRRSDSQDRRSEERKDEEKKASIT
jgi:hypothetical protein